MPIYTLPYGKSSRTFELPEGLQAELIAPQVIPAHPEPQVLVEAALDKPLGKRHLMDFLGVHSAVIAINDKTRPVPHGDLLPPLLERLHRLGLPKERITFVIANGTHPPMTPDEYERVLPQGLHHEYPVISHDCNDDSALMYLGKTALGTPVHIHRAYMAADLRLVVGNIEPHQFMGFSGGVKSVAVGLAGKATVNHNHALMTHPDSRLGHYAGNPARQDVEEIGRMIRVDFALNALLNGQKQIVEAFAGEPVAVMEAAIPRVEAIFQVAVSAPFDLLIASTGGHPKDINVYQAQKALAHARPILKAGGTLILLAACPEGAGSQTYEQWMLDKKSAADVLAAFSAEGYHVGPHKAYQIARDSQDVRVLWVTEMPPDLMHRLHLQQAESLESALAQALAGLEAGARVGILPAANATIARLHDKTT